MLKMLKIENVMVDKNLSEVEMVPMHETLKKSKYFPWSIFLQIDFGNNPLYSFLSWSNSLFIG